MARKKMFRKGESITTLEQMAGLYRKKAWIYYHEKPLHFGWWGSWSIHLCSHFINRNYLFLAVDNLTEETPHE